MKTIVFVGCCLVAVSLLAGCEKPTKEPETKLSAAERHTPISDSIRLKVIGDWQKFKKDSGQSLILAQEKLDQLEGKITDGETKEKVKMRRIYNASNYKLEKLKIKWLRQGIQFRSDISDYTQEDVLENESWRIGFNAKLTDLHKDLDEGLKINP